jgi:hypothetical protein
MDVIMLTNQVIQALTPLLPFFTGVGVTAGTAIVTKGGEDVYDQGKRLFHVVKTRVEEEKSVDDGKASKALQNFVENPDDYKDVLRKKLEALLNADPSFAHSVEQILDQSPALRQIILVGEDAIVHDNKQNNEIGYGEQRIEAGKGSDVTGNEQNIRRVAPSQ